MSAPSTRPADRAKSGGSPERRRPAESTPANVVRPKISGEIGLGLGLVIVIEIAIEILLARGFR
jgi:hypothetical protein